MKWPDKRFKTIYIDPPWPESGAGKVKRGADRHYDLMSIKEIQQLKVQSLAQESCHLYLWTTNNYLKDALEVIGFWGFRYVTCITWAKPKIGLGQYFRGQTEHCLFAVRGPALPYKVRNGKRQQGRTLLMPGQLFETFRSHSSKPGEMRKMIEIVSYAPFIELFARYNSVGWETWGDNIY